MSRLSPWPAALLLVALAVAVAVPLAVAQDPKQPKPQPKQPQPKPKQPQPKQPEPQPKQPEPQPKQPEQVPVGNASPLDLVKGLREQGMSDLALEYLKELEAHPLPPGVKEVLGLERAKCQLEAADDEPDEGARAALVAEATVGFAEFRRRSPNHPRAAEAAIALARLKSLEAKAQLVKARRIEVPQEDGPEKQKALKRVQEEAAKARPMFLEAANLFKEGSAKLDAQVKEATDPNLKRVLEQEQFDAELARGVNLFALGDTYLDAGAAELKERGKRLAEAKTVFIDLHKKPGSGRTGWVARAWAAECEFETDAPKVGEKEFDEILKSPLPAAEDGKRMVRYFQLRRAYVTALTEGDRTKFTSAENLARTWLVQYGLNRRARAEATATRFYLARLLQIEAYVLTPFPKDPKVPYKPGPQAEFKLKEAERLYRVITQTDNEYTDRATRYRMICVRQIVGEAEKPAAEYKTFEECQMAAVIQIAKMLDEDREGAKDDVLKARKLKIVALLERARVLAGPLDRLPPDISKSDVTDVLIQLVYFYEQTDQPHQAAVLGEYIARNLKTAGGKSSAAGALSLNAYAISTARIPGGGDVEEARRTDRARAIALARFIDQKFPNDPATDRARYRLGVLLFEEKDPVGAYEALIRVRPGFEGVIVARLYQGAIVSQMLTDANSPLPAERRIEVYRRTLEDLDRLQPPATTAEATLVRNYFTARVRLAMLLFLQPRVDPEAEKIVAGYPRAQAVTEELLAKLESFTALAETGEKKGPKQLTLIGWEVKLIAEEARARAAFLRANQMLGQVTDAAGYEPVLQVIGPILTDMQAGPLVDQVKAIPAPADDDPNKEFKAQQMQRLEQLATGADRIRRELVMVALKTRVFQGNPDAAVAQIELLEKFGGNIEANVRVLEQLTGELTGRIRALRRDGKQEEAKALAGGFAKVLAIVGSKPNLSPSMYLFLGQALIVVEDYTQAVEALKKIPPPRQEAWLYLPGAEFAKLPDDQRNETSMFRLSFLYRIRALRLGGMLDECEARLSDVMGNEMAKGWGFSSVEFRKERALLYEARGKADPNPAAAKTHFGRAMQEWTVLYTIARNRVDNDVKNPPKNGDNIDNVTILRNKNNLYDAFFDLQRCIVSGNTKLLAADPKKLGESYDKVAKQFVEVEKIMGDDLSAEVWERYADLLDEVPALKAAYQKAEGKKFLTHPPMP